MSDLICRKTMRACQQQNMCAPYQGCGESGPSKYAQYLPSVLPIVAPSPLMQFYADDAVTAPIDIERQVTDALQYSRSMRIGGRRILPPDIHLDAVPDHIGDDNEMIIPEGWQLVPKEPTQEMMGAADQLPEVFSIGDEYRAMLAAAPSPVAVPVSGWISVDERLPLSDKRIIFSWVNQLGKERTSIGQYNAKFSVEVSDSDCEECELNDADDTYYMEEGWQEWGWETEYSAYVTGVTHWMHLPPSPAKEE